MDLEKIEQAVTMIIESIGEDPNREGLRDTPRRVARMYAEVFSGLETDPEEVLEQFFTENHEELILVKDIPLFSVCEHHLLPVVGKAHVAYIPRRGLITGLSKLARVVDGYARRPQLQERLTAQIADAIMKRLEPHGVLVMIEAEHMCMTMRGVNKPGAQTVTSAVRGIFERNAKTRTEALALIKGR
ncbi:GTP cyclohydrolase I FolE [Candidatus Desulforudis audaxviator]|uniref:GTP cyclohydrolase 1 n=1 Tax=Desulforudis audaxviator (strain MP104C) TaxID=477974 RepID=B1I3V9_DESAP|nr:GTP cyclohydrolase I FolE [Candidatus Desulforudis audaxviator]ACA59744.1 GTP cyclohydrolase I [Candidatus Desulforudis audaxviator MP104C]AZK59739.1 GTP cyclohydrolase I [Candidatus Desulforudis audaxviator]